MHFTALIPALALALAPLILADDIQVTWCSDKQGAGGCETYVGNYMSCYQIPRSGGGIGSSFKVTTGDAYMCALYDGGHCKDMHPIGTFSPALHWEDIDYDGRVFGSFMCSKPRSD